MSEQVGAIHYDVELNTAQMVRGQREVDSAVSRAAGSFNAITSAVKLYAAAMALVKVAQFVTICLILIFFVTGWDSGTLVIDTMTSGGRTDTPLRQKAFWLFAVGGIGVMLLLTGGLNSLQAGSIATGLPLGLVLLLMCFGTFKGLMVLHRRHIE